MKKTAGDHCFLEVYLNTPIEVCEQRDEEGLYAKARSGEIPTFSGITAPYEAPASPELVLPTHELSVDECVDRIIHALRNQQVIE